jgi:hypothetical protein
MIPNGIVRQIAIHEAGHAIVAAAFHFKIEHAATLESGPLAGRVRIQAYSDSERPTPHAQIAFACAGYAAERIDGANDDIYDLYWEEGADGGDTRDLHHAERAALIVYGSEGRAWRAVELAWERVERWLRRPKHWAAALEVRERIERSSTVGGAEIYGIAQKHGVRLRDRSLLPRGAHIFLGDAEAVTGRSTRRNA